jgi:hypothetical protein
MVFSVAAVLQVDRIATSYNKLLCFVMAISDMILTGQTLHA